jgi:sorbitol/mannitol transport system substrate-binding protein
MSGETSLKADCATTSEHRRMGVVVAFACCALALTACFHRRDVVELTIGVVNNADMVLMKTLSAEFEKLNPHVRLNWVMLDENTLRQRVTTDVATVGRQFDVIMVGTYEVPIWAKKKWLAPITDLPGDYDVNDLLKPVRDGLSVEGLLYALPFYGESSMTYYRKDLFAAKGLAMPAQPTYEDIERFAEALTDRQNQLYGVCLRGQPGWGANMALISTMVNTFGGHWFDEGWHATIDTPEWKRAVGEYIKLLSLYGPPGANSNNFNENLALFAGGHCAIWIDATVGAGILSDPRQSDVATKVAFAPAPVSVTPRGAHWLWAWALGVAQSSAHRSEAMKFITWASSKDYIKTVGELKGWGAVPPGTRYSTYENSRYLQAAPYAALVLGALNTTDATHPSLQPVPYTGIQYVSIPEFQAIGTQTGQLIAGVLAGRKSLDSALASAQLLADRAVRQAGYQQ